MFGLKKKVELERTIQSSKIKEFLTYISLKLSLQLAIKKLGFHKFALILALISHTL
jgi:hypothetical protein